MQVIEMQQNTPEWIEWRSTKIGASDAPIICGVSPYKKPLKLWEEKITGAKSSITESMQRGHDLEDMIRNMVNENESAKYEPLCVQDEMYDWMIASLDGYDRLRDKILEIKTTKRETFDKVKAGDIPIHWIYQMQHQMFVTNFFKARLAVFCEDELYETCVHRDEAIIEEILAKEEAFYQSLITFQPPESDIKKRDDEEAREVVEAFKAAKEARDDAEEQYKICRDSIVYVANGESFECDGVKARKTFTKGSIDYKAAFESLPESKGVNLEMFRKPAREVWNIS